MPLVAVTDEEMADLLKESGTKADTEKKREKVVGNFRKNVENQGIFFLPLLRSKNGRKLAKSRLLFGEKSSLLTYFLDPDSFRPGSGSVS